MRPAEAGRVQVASDRRYKKRLPCRLRLPSGPHAGMVLNVSRGGLFVQTSAPASPGDAVHVDLDVSEGERVALDARVVWRRVVASHLRAVSTGGMGLHIQYAGAAYFGYLAQLSGRPGGDEALARAVGPAWRVRLRLAGGSRTRSVTVAAADESEAAARARDVAGAQWIVLAVESDAREA